MFNSHSRATKNLRMLEFVARKLGKINDEVVYLGGCSTALFITDTLSLDVRPTKDVDGIVDIISLSKYYDFGEKLKAQGFQESKDDEVMCRWHYNEIILDVMPIDEKILKFGNPWYKDAIKTPIAHKLKNDLIIKSVTAPYLLATKIEAFNTRGNKDFLGSHDFEDIITIIAGREEIVNEISIANEKLKLHLKDFFDEIVQKDSFRTALPGHISDGPATLERLEVVMGKIKKIISC